MSDSSERLRRLWALDEPPAGDAGFRLGVLERLERPRLGAGLLRAFGMAAVAGIVAWAGAPLLVEALRTAEGLVVLAAVFGLIGLLAGDDVGSDASLG